MKKLLAFTMLIIFLTSCTTKKEEVSLFYYKQDLDPSFTCQEEAFLPVKRLIKPENGIIFDTINLLISNDLSQQEIKEGFSTEFPHEDFKLLKAELNENGTLYLDFTEVPGFTSGGSMRMRILRTQIEKTALQFPEVKNLIMNNDEIFQP